ncbi:hypothetical protein AYL99_11711 [Fonsecaea erecta]|uniref:PWWP domain-containing protein n=1 Tax=Fonsecaea erecta TaxID=1367422 RepID=A0A178Z3W3_9EURO|nr:hypothetical protein AYL99_11711 [Fonsecaea erecta]OAP54176.1 hypothetical protein AYL99_11711 [Fonsecaea erecta]
MPSRKSAPATEVPVKVPQPTSDVPSDKSATAEPAQTTDAATASGPVETVSAEAKEPEKPVTEPQAASAVEIKKEMNGPATAQPKSNGTASADKKSSVAESKSKQANKRKSTSKITHVDAQPGDYYLARGRGFRPWPCIIADESMLPEKLINTRPPSTKQIDGTYNEAYADGGKKVDERTFPIMFLSTNEFMWIRNTDLTALTPDECKDVSTRGRAKPLLAAYKIAAEGHDLQFFKDILDEHAMALQYELDMREAEKAEKASNPDKRKRKSEVKVKTEDAKMEDTDVDVEPKEASKKRKMEIDETGDADVNFEPKKASKKRKVEVDEKEDADVDAEPKTSPDKAITILDSEANDSDEDW